MNDSIAENPWEVASQSWETWATFRAQKQRAWAMQQARRMVSYARADRLRGGAGLFWECMNHAAGFRRIAQNTTPFSYSHLR